MFARSFRLVITIGLVLQLAACVTFPGMGRPLSYNVRSVTVMANAALPLDLLDGVDRRVGAAIAATNPPQGAERVVLLIRIDRLDKGNNARWRMDRAHFTVTATSVETGEPVAEGRLVANSPTDDPRFAYQALAEEMAEKVRYAFALSSPVARTPDAGDASALISTRLKNDPPLPRFAPGNPVPGKSGPLAAAPNNAAGPRSVSAPIAQRPAATGSANAGQALRSAPAKTPVATVDEGAQGKIRLDRGCDTTTVPDCLTAKP